MGKFKKNKRVADAVYAKKSVDTGKNSNPFALAKPATSSKLNPFEVHVNREKFQILGRTCKHDKGLPGVSRAKAQKKRKQTLGVEYQEKNKSNRFRDRRIGKHLSASELTEDVINARFLADKLGQAKATKASKFDLNDDVVLTHRGTTLAEIEQFRDDRSDDDDEENERLDADFTEATHFGGGEQQVKDRKAAIDEMILEQKKRKMEIAKEKDELYDLTEKLDSNYKNLVSVMGKMSQKGEKEKPVHDDFDKLMREMVFDRRGVVTDKLQSEEEIARKEKERLERLENERLKRMHADGEENTENNQPNHRSADDLDDGYFAYGAQNEEQDNILTYNLDGQLEGRINENGNRKNATAKNGEGSDQEDDEEKGSGSEDEEEEESESNENTDEEEESDDDLSDLKYEDSEAEASETENKSSAMVKKGKTKINNENKKQEIETVLPYTIELPSKYDDFLRLITKHTPTDQATIVERITKCNHPKLDGVNREKVVKLFAFLLQYINELFTEVEAENIALSFEILDNLNPHLFDLIHLNPEKMSNTFLDVIKEKYANYRKRPKTFPTLETLVYFKLASNLFTTSDFRHPVVTPCFIFIEHVLQRARVRTRQEIARGLFLVTILLEYTHQSKRFLPGANNFLLGTLFMCIPKRPVEQRKVIPPFQSSGPFSNLLVLTEDEKDNATKEIKNELIKSEDFLLEDITSDFKVRALQSCLQITKEFIEIIGENVGANYIAESLLDSIERLPLDSYPSYVEEISKDVIKGLKEIATKPLTKLVPPEKKPKALRLLEPRIETVYDDKRRPKMSKEKTERVKMIHKIKRETKGAVREIRRDTEFLQKMRIQQQLQSDKERHEKVKRILHEASTQQGELNELDRAKKRKKF